MIKFARFMQWWCVIFGIADFGVCVWRFDDGRWGWGSFELGLALVMVVFWRVNGKLIEREESRRLERELWHG